MTSSLTRLLQDASTATYSDVAQAEGAIKLANNLVDVTGFEPCPCMLCASDCPVPAGHTEWRGARLTYSICGNCGLKYMAPRPTREWYHEFYRTEFWEDKFRNRTWRRLVGFDWLWKLAKGGKSGRVRKGRKRAQLVVPDILAQVPLSSTSRVLDVGCAFGMILHEIRQRTGAAVLGIEPNESARKIALKHTPIEFIGKVAEDTLRLTADDGRFDLIIFSNVLENIVDPRPVLKACRRLLSKTGVLYIDTPNVYYYDAMNPYHPYIYSPETIVSLVADCGFEVRNSFFEPPVQDKANVKVPFKSRRPRFVTLYATAGEATPVKANGIEAEKLLASIAVSTERYEQQHEKR